MKKNMLWNVTIVTAIFLISGCAAVPKEQDDRLDLSSEVDQAITVMIAKDPELRSFFESSYGYAVLPKVFKGAFWVGGANGQGEVYERGTRIGYCNLSQATLGFSFGGQFFREIIFFRDKSDLDRFRSDEFTFAAQATAVALKTGAAGKTGYRDGMAVFVMAESGLMVDFSLGGQKFKYAPIAF